MSMIEVTEIERRIADRVDPHVSNALTISRQTGGVVFTNASETMEFAKMMAVSQIGVRKHLRGNVGACLAIVVQAVEWGVSPYAVANKSYLVNDQIAFESQLIQAIILRRAPIKGRIRYSYTGEGAKRKCFASATLADGTGDVEYESPELSKITPQNSPLWKSDPDQQLSYYCGRALCRRHFPDVLLGIFDIDEMPAITQSTREPPRGLSNKLDAIANMGISEIIDHNNTETGAGAAPQAAGEEAGDARSTDAGDTPAADIVETARAKAMEGRKTFNAWFAGIGEAAQASLQGHMKSLLAAADAVGDA